MKKLSLLLIVTLILGLTFTTAMAIEDADGTKLVGEHYNLNIIGVQNPKTAEMTDSNRNTIFVPLYDKAKIELKEAPEGESYKVLDGNATDGPAQLQLPNPDLDAYIVGEKGDADTISKYSVFVRPLGKPGGMATITTCAEVLDNEALAAYLGKKELRVFEECMNEEGHVVSVEQVGSEITTRTKGKTQFTNVTAELLTIVLKIEVTNLDDTVYVAYVRIRIFDESLDGEYWEYDNDGLKLLQVRFYPIPTDVSEGDGELPPLD